MEGRGVLHFKIFYREHNLKRMPINFTYHKNETVKLRKKDLPFLSYRFYLGV